MEIVVIGTGDAFSTGRAGSSAVVLAPGGHVLIDAPDGLFRALAEASLRSGVRIDPETIDDILLTHLHADHANGLEMFGFRRWVDRRNGRGCLPRLHTPAGVAARLWERLAPSMDQGGSATLADYFDVRILPEGAACDVAGLSVRQRGTQHSIPCCGFLLSAGGRTLGWSGDTVFDPEHIAWLGAADLIVHETSESAIHTPIAELNALPAEVRRKMRLVHMADDFDPACTDIKPLAAGERVAV
jgi:ribonuclease BN (tRNA processing enzyme)